MSRISSVLTTVVATTACVCVSVQPAAASGPVVSRGVTIPAFYTPPAELPAGNGVLVRHEPLSLGLSLPGLDGRPLPGTATRLMYTSTDSGGQPVAVTGAYIEPSADWEGDGPRPLVVVGSGTMGQGDQYAPSLSLEHPLTVTPQTVSIGYENLAVFRLLATGAAVVVTDYVGPSAPPTGSTPTSTASTRGTPCWTPPGPRVPCPARPCAPIHGSPCTATARAAEPPPPRPSCTAPTPPTSLSSAPTAALRPPTSPR
ncbi:hypothetical protein RKD26_006455 [Streptomyces calvus]